MRPQSVSSASNWKMMMEPTKPTWRGDFRISLKRPGKSPNTGYPAAALITQSFTVRRLVMYGNNTKVLTSDEKIINTIISNLLLKNKLLSR